MAAPVFCRIEVYDDEPILLNVALVTSVVFEEIDNVYARVVVNFVGGEPLRFAECGHIGARSVIRKIELAIHDQLTAVARARAP